MNTRTLMLVATLATAALAGCAAPRSPSLVTLPEGYQVVAEGRPPIGFFMASGGQVIVTDVTARSTVYSMDYRPTNADAEAGGILKVEDDKLVAQSAMSTGDDDNNSITLLSGLDADHNFRIVFRPASPATRPATTAVPTIDVPAVAPTTAATR